MLLNMLRSSRFLRALVLTGWVAGFLAWFYIVARVIVDQVDVHTPFLDSVPSISISAVGAFTFLLGCASMFVYLWLWGRFDGRYAVPTAPGQREP